MKRIPISAAEHIAKDYGYDQVIIYARKVGDDPNPHGEHLTTYGINKVHCDVAARIGEHLRNDIFKWNKENDCSMVCDRILAIAGFLHIRPLHRMG